MNCENLECADRVVSMCSLPEPLLRLETLVAAALRRDTIARKIRGIVASCNLLTFSRIGVTLESVLRLAYQQSCGGFPESAIAMSIVRGRVGAVGSVLRGPGPGSAEPGFARAGSPGTVSAGPVSAGPDSARSDSGEAGPAESTSASGSAKAGSARPGFAEPESNHAGEQ